jgi:hypothetical protein
LQHAPAVIGQGFMVGGQIPPAVHTISGAGHRAWVVMEHWPVNRLQHAPFCRHGGICEHVWLG